MTANGTAASPILFTAAQASPGYWGGIQFTFSKNINNVLNYVTVEYAGGAGLNGQGAVILFGSETSATITNSMFRFSESYGIWLDVGSQFNANIDTVNTFANNTLGSVFRSP